MDNWIKSSERLPDSEHHRQDIILNWNGNVAVGSWSNLTGRFLDRPCGFEILGVTHWQPLPEPPR